MKISECVEILKKNTPEGFNNNWMPCAQQLMVCVLYLDNSVAVDVMELVDKTDNEIKELIKRRMISALRAVIMKIEPNYFTSPG